jgi:hypothetical protein
MEHLLRWGEKTHTKKSAWVPKIKEPYYICYHILSDVFQKEAKYERHGRKVSPFNCSRQGEKIS